MTLTSKGQVTIPKEIRDALGVKPHDKVEFVIENGEVKLRRARFSLREMAGMFPPIGIPVEDLPAVAREDWVERFLEESA